MTTPNKPNNTQQDCNYSDNYYGDRICNCAAKSKPATASAAARGWLNPLATAFSF